MCFRPNSNQSRPTKGGESLFVELRGLHVLTARVVEVTDLAQGPGDQLRVAELAVDGQSSLEALFRLPEGAHGEVGAAEVAELFGQ